MPRSFIRNLALMFTAVCVAGCQSPYIRMPNFAHPGTAAQQRADAERFDPYPDPDAGPPVVGGRPLGYTRPLTETEWSRRFVPPPLGVAQPAPVITNPFPPTAPPAYTPTYSPAAPTYSPPAAFTPAAPPALPAPTNPSQIQPRSPY